MARIRVTIVMAGHVDHGKSTLIGRLLHDTGSLPAATLSAMKKTLRTVEALDLAHLTDHFQEERDHKMTIDTTQIFLKTGNIDCVIIDSPGHTEFIKNMLSGATQATAAILIVDAAAGIQEQTKRHAYLLHMLGIRNIIVVFNKMDLLDYREDRFLEQKKKLSIFLKNLGIKPAAVIPISAREGRNISTLAAETPWYKGIPLLRALASVQHNKRTHRSLRLPIQDIYLINSQKIIVGKILSGNVTAGQKISFLPSRRTAIIKSVKIFGQSRRRACEGENIGLILADPSPAHRGEIIVSGADKLPPTKNFTGNVFWLSDQPLEINARVMLQCATQKIYCLITSIKEKMDSSTLKGLGKKSNELRVNETALVTFAAEEEIMIEHSAEITELGRFVIRQDEHVQGIGIII